MQLAFSVPPTSGDSAIINGLLSQKSSKLLLHKRRLSFYNYWTVNNHVRLKNEKLSKRQQTSCRIAFYSFWLCVIASVTIIVIYRFTDECPITTTNPKQILMECLKYRLFLVSICISLLACGGVIFGACRYFRSQPDTVLNGTENEPRAADNNDLLSMSTTSHPYSYPTLLTNGTSFPSPPIIQNCNDEHSNPIVISPVRNISPRRKIPPFNYDEMPPVSNPIIISKSPIKNNNIFFSPPTSPLSSPQSIFSTTENSNIINSKTTSFFEDTYANPSTSTPKVDVWKKQQRPPSFR